LPTHNRRPTATVISPTKNEAPNIEEFVERATSALASSSIAWEIVFADDSDDHTPDIIEKLAREGHPVRCVHRTPEERRESISGAVRHALTTVRSDVAVVIDADLQHPPEILPHLITPILEGRVDFSIGSRYIGHGSAEGLGSQWRRVASRASAKFTALIFPQFARSSDLASGLFAFRVRDFELASTRSSGFKVLPEALVRCDPKRVMDVPYTFEERFDGLSKARLRDGIKLALALLRLRLTTARIRRVTMVPFTEHKR